MDMEPLDSEPHICTRSHTGMECVKIYFLLAKKFGFLFQNGKPSLSE
jgi:hypothetical protein